VLAFKYPVSPSLETPETPRSCAITGFEALSSSHSHIKPLAPKGNVINTLYSHILLFEVLAEWKELLKIVLGKAVVAAVNL
jgi:hypothetical protein